MNSPLIVSWVRIPDLVINKYKSSHPQSLKNVTDLLANEKSVAEALKESSAPTGTSRAASASPQAPSVLPPSRTLASPDYDGAEPPNMDRMVEFAEKSMDDFNSTQTLLESISSTECFWGFVKYNDHQVAR